VKNKEYSNTNMERIVTRVRGDKTEQNQCRGGPTARRDSNILPSMKWQRVVVVEGGRWRNLRGGHAMQAYGRRRRGRER